MNCYMHYDRQAVGRCEHCGQPICAECKVDIGGHVYCKSCVAAFAGGHSQNNNQGQYFPPPKPAYHKGPFPGKGRDINAFFLFCLSCLPGLNYMYIGLMKRGVFFMSVFFLLVSLTAVLDIPMFIFAAFIELCYSFFDGFRIRREILGGAHISDDVSDVSEIIVQNKAAIIIMVTLVIGASLVQRVFRIFSHSMESIFGFGNYWELYDLLYYAFGTVIFVAGAFFIIRLLSKRSKSSRNNDVNDKYINK